MTSPPSPDLKLEVPKRLAGVRFDRALGELVPARTRSQLQKLVRRGRVKLDGKRVLRSNFNLRGGESLSVQLDENVDASPAVEYLHVEAEFAAINKPAGMLVQPTEARPQGTLANLLVERFGPLPSVVGEERPGIVHRLDRETSGVMVIARTERALEQLRAQFKARTVAKTYLALVYGNPREESFEVDAPLASVPGQKDLQRIDAAGRAALSHFTVLRRGRRVALLECRPQTGRRHQLRVHLAAHGHPVVGDKLYRPPRTVERLESFGQHALHALGLEFDHPRTGARLDFEAAPPAAFARFIDDHCPAREP